VRRREQLDVRPDLDVVADRDRRDVERDQAEVHERPRPDLDLVAVVDVQRSAYLGVLADRAEKLREQPLPQSGICGSREVQLMHQCVCPLGLLREHRVVGDVEIAREQPLALAPHVGLGH
jgi:hypothetical protein